MSRRNLSVVLCSLAGLGIAAGLVWARWVSWPEVMASIEREFPAVEQLSTAELARWLDDPERVDPVLLDVRRAEEFAVSHLAGARQVAPEASAADVAAVLPDGLPTDTPIVLYCSVGYRSSRLAQRLSEAGYSQVANLEGSIFRWANEDRPLVRLEGVADVSTHQVHPYDRLWGRLLERDRWAWEP